VFTAFFLLLSRKIHSTSAGCGRVFLFLFSLFNTKLMTLENIKIRNWCIPFAINELKFIEILSRVRVRVFYANPFAIYLTIFLARVLPPPSFINKFAYTTSISFSFNLIKNWIFHQITIQFFFFPFFSFSLDSHIIRTLTDETRREKKSSYIAFNLGERNVRDYISREGGEMSEKIYIINSSSNEEVA